MVTLANSKRFRASSLSLKAPGSSNTANGNWEETGLSAAGEFDDANGLDQASELDRAGGCDCEPDWECDGADRCDGKSGDVDKESGVGEEGGGDEGPGVDGCTWARGCRSKVAGFWPGLRGRVSFDPCGYQNNLCFNGSPYSVSSAEYIQGVQYSKLKSALKALLAQDPANISLTTKLVYEYRKTDLGKVLCPKLTESEGFESH